MSIAKFKAGRSGASGANAAYITREDAAEKILFFNLDTLTTEDLPEARTNAIAYAQMREDVELAKNEKARTHYRMILSYPNKVTSETAVEDTRKFLRKNLPDVRAIIAIHQDTDNTHPHVWIDSRKTDGRKIHLNIHQLERISDGWTELYDETYGTNYAPEYKAKKLEKKRLKMRQAKPSENSLSSSETVPPNASENYPKPEHRTAGTPVASDAFDHTYWREKEIEEKYGLKPDSQKTGKKSQARVKVEHAAPSEHLLVQEQIKRIVSTATAEKLITKNTLTQRPAAIDFINELKEQGVFFNPNIKKSGKVVGVSFSIANTSGRMISFKGSDLGNDFKWGEIVKKIEYIPERDGKVFRAAKSQSKLAAGKEIQITQNNGATENDENRFRANSADAQTGNRFIERAELSVMGTESLLRFQVESEGRRTRAGERGNPVSAFSDRTDDGIGAENGKDFTESKESKFSVNVDEGKPFAISLPFVFDNDNIGIVAEESNQQENTEVYFYQHRLQDCSTAKESILGRVSEEFRESEYFEAIDVELSVMPPIEICEPQIALDTNALVDDFLEIIQENCRRQNLEISERTHSILTNQLREDALVNSQGERLDASWANPIEILGQTESSVGELDDDRINTSKLEADYDRISLIKNDAELKYELNKIVDEMERRAASQETEKQTEEEEYEEEIRDEFVLSL